MSELSKARAALEAAEDRMRTSANAESATAWVLIANGWLRAAAIRTQQEGTE